MGMVTWVVTLIMMTDGRKGVLRQGRRMSGSGTAERRQTAETHQFWARDRTMTAKTIIDSSRSIQKSPSGEVDKERAEQTNDMNPESQTNSFRGLCCNT